MRSNDIYNTAIQMEMTRRGMTGKELAERIGINQQTMSRRTTGKVPWTLEELDNVAAVFNMDTFQLADLASKYRTMGNGDE